MEVWILLAVVVTTAIFVYHNNKIKENEVRETQKLLLQFIDHFEEQMATLEKRIEQKNRQWEAEIAKLYASLEQMKNPLDQSKAEQRDEEKQDSLRNENPSDLLKINDRYASLLQLHHEGYSIEEIARRTGKGIGELQLIFQLLDVGEVDGQP